MSSVVRGQVRTKHTGSVGSRTVDELLDALVACPALLRVDLPRRARSSETEASYHASMGPVAKEAYLRVRSRVGIEQYHQQRKGLLCDVDDGAVRGVLVQRVHGDVVHIGTDEGALVHIVEKKLLLGGVGSDDDGLNASGAPGSRLRVHAVLVPVLDAVVLESLSETFRMMCAKENLHSHEQFNP